DIAAVAHAHGALFHCDAVQAAGKMPLDITDLAADLVSLSAHKLGGPPGIGALVVTGGAEIAALTRGGGQERGRRAGSENPAGIAAGTIRISLGWSTTEADIAHFLDAWTALARRLAPQRLLTQALSPVAA